MLSLIQLFYNFFPILRSCILITITQSSIMATFFIFIVEFYLNLCKLKFSYLKLNLFFYKETRSLWIEYSAKDAMATWHVHNSLVRHLQNRDWIVDDKKRGTMFDFYEQFLAPFGELLTDMEKNGIKVDKNGLLKSAEASARAEKIVRLFLQFFLFTTLFNN